MYNHQNRRELNRIHMKNGIQVEQHLVGIMISVLYDYAEKFEISQCWFTSTINDSFFSVHLLLEISGQIRSLPSGKRHCHIDLLPEMDTVQDDMLWEKHESSGLDRLSKFFYKNAR